jgi:hypothetical protein
LRESETTVRLPLYAYAAVGWRPQGFFTTAIRVDADVGKISISSMNR